MRLVSIHLRNLRAHADTAVALPLGVVAITGNNESGKSTLATEAACWALFGADAIRGSKAGLRWHGAPARAPASVELVFEIGGVTYEVERTESDAFLRLHTHPVAQTAPGSPYPIVRSTPGRIIAQGTKPVNEAIPKLLGMSFAEFSASYLVLQKDLTRLSAMGPTERQAFVRRVMGVESIDAGLKACRKKKSELASLREGAAYGLGDRQPLVDAGLAAEEALEEAESDAAVTARDAQEAKEIHSVGAAALTASVARKEKARELQGQRDFQLQEVARLSRELGPVEASIEAHDAETAKQRTALDADLQKRAAAVAELRAKVTALTNVPSAYSEADHHAALDAKLAAEEERDRLRNERLAARAVRLGAVEAGRREHKKVLEKQQKVIALGADGPCPTCLQVLGSHKCDALIAQLDNEAHDIRLLFEQDGVVAKEYEQPGDDEKAAVAAIFVAAERISAIEVLQENARQDRVRITGLEAQLVAAERERADAGVRAAMHTHDRHIVLEYMQKRVADIRAAQTRATERLRLLDGELAALAFDPQRHDRLKADLDRDSATLSKALVAAAGAQERVRGAEASLANAKRQLVEYDVRAEKVAEIARAFTLHEKVEERLNGFRTAVAGTIRPEMEELVSGFVSILTDGRHEAVELTEDFAVVAFEGGVPMEVVSGGAEDLIALSLRLAISQMIAERAGHPLSLLILDEPYASLDATRRAGMTALLKRLSSIFSQVIVISHIAETRDMADHTIALEYDEAAGRTRLL